MHKAFASSIVRCAMYTEAESAPRMRLRQRKSSFLGFWCSSFNSFLSCSESSALSSGIGSKSLLMIWFRPMIVIKNKTVSCQRASKIIFIKSYKAAGSACGAVVANLYDIPKVDMNVSHPGLMRTLKCGGTYGLAFAAISGIYVGVEHYMFEKRKKKDFVNGAAAAFVAGASVLGLKGRSVSFGILSGAALAATSTLIDFSFEDTGINTEKQATH